VTILLNLHSSPWNPDVVPHIQDVITYLVCTHGIWLTPFEPLPVLDGKLHKYQGKLIDYIMVARPGIVITENHALAWDTKYYYDSEMLGAAFNIREIWLTKDIEIK